MVCKRRIILTGPMNVLKVFGARVRYLREQRSWSQETLADYAGLHRTYISGVERGVRNPSLTIVFQLASALKVSPSDLLDVQADRI